ncbi:exodeoxyribonuclease VII large subunit [Vibrio sp. F74]|uniref:exodeoxyribonuclease VII large subunit n=1 Tax=Vibrio sp. F74 TaxID=700020 RepID=UPI0035F5D664
MLKSVESTSIEYSNQSLFQLMSHVKDVVERGVSGRYWITAELADINCHKSGHVYLQLTDKKDNEQEAQARGVIWANRSDIITSFEKSTQITFGAGLRILCLVEVKLHPKHGLNLSILDINPGYTVGEFKLKLQGIRNALKDSGEAKLNKSLVAPKDFTRVAVIAPQNASGLADFRSKADLLQKHNLCHFDYYYATFQGDRRVNSIKAAFAEIAQNPAEYDSVCLIRGGGDKASLNELSELGLAKVVCVFRYPVYTGVGHADDSVILDEYANRSFETPSMVINHIQRKIVRNARYAKELYTRMKSKAEFVCGQQKQIHQQDFKQVQNGKYTILNNCKNQVEQLGEQLFERSRSRVRDSKSIVVRQTQLLVGNARHLINEDKLFLQQNRQLVVQRAYQSVNQSKVTLVNQQQLLKTASQSVVVRADQHVQEHYKGLRQSSAQLITNAKQQNRQLWLNMSQHAKSNLQAARYQSNYIIKNIAFTGRMLAVKNKQEIGNYKVNLFGGAQKMVAAQRQDIVITRRTIDLCDPKHMLERGYALVYSNKGDVIRSVSQVSKEQKIKIQLHDGMVSVINCNS